MELCTYLGLAAKWYEFIISISSPLDQLFNQSLWQLKVTIDSLLRCSIAQMVARYMDM